METISEKIILETKNITKDFGKVVANKDISIQLKEGEVISLLGENGAGKSTLVNILYGLYSPTSGTFYLNGTETHFTSPRDAINAGIGMVHQHFMLIDTLTVMENIILGDEPGRGGIINYTKAREKVKEISKCYGLEVDPDACIDTLSVGTQQRVEILKALYRDASVLILDEPTAVLTPKEIDELFLVIEKLKNSGVSIIIITHKLEEVRHISQRVYILRRGEIKGECCPADVSGGDLANMMVGRNVVLTVKKDQHQAKDSPVFSLHNLSVNRKSGVPALKNISLDIHPGEIVGIAGVDGNGQSELNDVIMGLRKPGSGEFRFKGKVINKLNTKKRKALGISYVPSDRHKDGLVLPFTIAENIAIGEHNIKPNSTAGILNYDTMRKQAEKMIKNYDIRASGPLEAAANLSGGNQQKVILAREIERDPDFFLVSQPTRGLDVGAIEYIHKQILKMRDADKGVLLVSLELEEIFALSDRILVLYDGKFVKELKPEDTNEREVGIYMTGGNMENVNG